MCVCLRNEDTDLLNWQARGITSRCEKKLCPGSAIDSLCCQSFHIKSRAFFLFFLKKKDLSDKWSVVRLFILLIDRSASSAAGTPAAFPSRFFRFLPQQDSRSRPPAETRTETWRIHLDVKLNVCWCLSMCASFDDFDAVRSTHSSRLLDM